MPIKKCSCKSEYQDTLYGFGNRIQNLTVKGNVRCTVCGKENNADFKAKADKPAKK